MKNLLNLFQLSLLLSFILISSNLSSQSVGINITGATPSSSAMLDIDVTNKGLLIPRVAIT